LLHLVRQGLAATVPLWPPIERAYAVVHHAAHLLANHDLLDAAALRQVYDEQVLVPLRAVTPAHWGPLAPAAAHFVKVTASYWPGLFHCYDVPALPRTNNDLEQYFGAARHAERRATGRKSASPALVVRGAVRVVALLATRHQPPLSAAELRPRDVGAWQVLRQQVERRHDARRAHARFRRDPIPYLTALEEQLVAKPVLPP
jgi:hypothetical protein